MMALLEESADTTSLLEPGRISPPLRQSLTTSTGEHPCIYKPIQQLNWAIRFGGLALDLNKPGTIMVAALNEWWPDANIFRSLDSGVTWSPLWEWNGYPTINRYFGLDNSLVPWLGGPLGNQDVSLKEVGWMIEALAIDPFDSNHWLYGTGATVSGGHNLLNWDSVHNVTIKAYGAGIEETAVLGLISPPTGTPHLLSVVGDIGGKYIFTAY